MATDEPAAGAVPVNQFVAALIAATRERKKKFRWYHERGMGWVKYWIVLDEVRLVLLETPGSQPMLLLDTGELERLPVRLLASPKLLDSLGQMVRDRLGLANHTPCSDRLTDVPAEVVAQLEETTGITVADFSIPLTAASEGRV